MPDSKKLSIECRSSQTACKPEIVVLLRTLQHAAVNFSSPLQLPSRGRTEQSTHQYCISKTKAP